MLFAALAISLALGVAGLLTYLQFKKHSNELSLRQLDEHFVELLGYLEVNQNGNPDVSADLSDPRFNHPYSGLYWQVDMPGKESARSRSLWEERLNVSTPPEEEEEEHVHELAGPNGVQLIGLERMVKLRQDDGTEPSAIVTVAMDAATVNRVQDSFLYELLWGLGFLYLALLAGSFAQIMIGLRPLKALRKNLEVVRSGVSSHLDGQYPVEVTPLVGELNGLLHARERQLERARQRASNLAHGLKTPLTVMKTLAQNLRNKGDDDISHEIDSNSNLMRDLVDRELARARASDDARTTYTPLRPAVAKIINTLRHVSELGIDFENAVPEKATIPMENGDVLELVGNLLDNSRRYANSLVRVGLEPGRLYVEDDGPGVPAEKLSHIVKRGGKLDEKSGTGLGLAIVTDLAENYGFDLDLSHSPMGGLRVEVIWADLQDPGRGPALEKTSTFNDRTPLVHSGGTKLLLNTK
jgi:signal transduction histidine kinase